MNRFRFTTICVLFFFTAQRLIAQDTVLNKYNLWVITSSSQLRKTIRKDADKLMLDVKQQVPDIVLDLRYATLNNFMHTKLYPFLTTTFLRRPAVLALVKVQNELKLKGLGIKIFDAYRPYSVTEKMWEPVQDDRYAADPKKGSGHNRGIAVDLTIIDLRTKKELDMGTGFDNFTDSAHHNFIQLPEAVLKNRVFLKTIMEKNGFKALDTEWWHYSLSDAAKFELLDIPFAELK
ncbi:MAG: M15 family metallopeptidase [Ferruginibacter sp.]